MRRRIMRDKAGRARIIARLRGGSREMATCTRGNDVAISGIQTTWKRIQGSVRAHWMRGWASLTMSVMVNPQLPRWARGRVARDLARDHCDRNVNRPPTARQILREELPRIALTA